VATFIIVILLLIGVGISVGVVFATIKSDKSSSSGSNNHEFSSIYIVIAYYCVQMNKISYDFSGSIGNTITDEHYYYR